MGAIKTCNGCKANVVSRVSTCELRFKNEASKRIDGIAVQWRPIGECPKPKTNRELNDLMMATIRNARAVS